MSFRPKRTMTAARLPVNRLSVVKSTGPRTAAGKRRSGPNAIRGGGQSKTNALFWQVPMPAPVREAPETAQGLMTREQYLHYEYLLELFRSRRDVEDEACRRKARKERGRSTVEA